MSENNFQENFYLYKVQTVCFLKEFLEDSNTQPNLISANDSITEQIYLLFSLCLNNISQSSGPELNLKRKLFPYRKSSHFNWECHRTNFFPSVQKTSLPLGITGIANSLALPKQYNSLFSICTQLINQYGSFSGGKKFFLIYLIFTSKLSTLQDK